MNGFTPVARGVASLAAFAIVSGAQAQPSPAVKATILVNTCKPPSMPMAAAREGAEGTTRLLFHVDANGKATQVDIVGPSGSSNGHKLLDLSAAIAFMQCSFTAAQDADGNPVDGTVKLDYTWVIN
jgi:TonB family protein